MRPMPFLSELTAPLIAPPPDWAPRATAEPTSASKMPAERGVTVWDAGAVVAAPAVGPLIDCAAGVPANSRGTNPGSIVLTPSPGMLCPAARACPNAVRGSAIGLAMSSEVACPTGIFGAGEAGCPMPPGIPTRPTEARNLGSRYGPVFSLTVSPSMLAIPAPPARTERRLFWSVSRVNLWALYLHGDDCE